MGPPPVVTGISPKEACPGTKITVRGENLGTSQQDILGIYIHKNDCFPSMEWKSSNKLTVLCPGIMTDNKGDIIVITRSGGMGTCTVQLRIFRENIGPLKEVALWMTEKSYFRRKNRVFSPNLMNNEDALGLSVADNNHAKLPEDQLRQIFPYKSSDLSSDNFNPSYFLLDNHCGTTFEDLQAGVGFLRRKVDGENESQLSFIKANVNSIMDQLDTLRNIKNRYIIDNQEYGNNPTALVEISIDKAKREADQMFVDVLGRKDRADSTRNAINVMNRFNFLFNLPSNIESNLSKKDFDRIIDEYERGKSLYGENDGEIFRLYLDESEKGIEKLKIILLASLHDPTLNIEQKKKVIANLVQLEVEGDQAWNCLQLQCDYVLTNLDKCLKSHLDKKRKYPFSKSLPHQSSKNLLFPAAYLEETQDSYPQCILFIQSISEQLLDEFSNLWKFGQAYFKGELIVEPDTSKQLLFKEMILNVMQYFSNLIRAAIIPQTIKSDEKANEYGYWGGDNEKNAAFWLPSCLRQIRKTYASFIEMDLPGQALDIVKQLTTDLRIQCLQMIFQTVTDQSHLLHEKEDWCLDITDDAGAITDLPEAFESLVTQSVQLIKESLLPINNNEEDILSYQNAHKDLELLIQNVLSSFAFTLENAAVENYNSLSNLPSETMRLLLCLNNCRYTQTKVLPKIQKSFQEIGKLSFEAPIIEANRCYSILHGKLMEAYLEQKCDPIVAIIEPSMYVGKFDWARCQKPTDARDYIKEILHNIIAVHSEVESVSAINDTSHNYLKSILERVIESVTEEVNRLFCCINRMNSSGCMQAWVDIHSLQFALHSFLTKSSNDFLSDAAKPLYDLERPGDKEIIDECIQKFKERMNFHLTILQK